jgi:ATP-binding cassette subfamily B protein/ATP-binding cassette subfamily C protein
MPYRLFLQRNSSKLTQIISGEALNVSSLVQNILLLCSEVSIILLLYAMIVTANWRITIILSVVLLATVIIITSTVTRESKREGDKRAEAHQNLHKTLGQTFGNLKFVKIKGNEKNILTGINEITNKITRSQIVNSTLSIIPRNILESLGFSLLIAAVLFIQWRFHSPDKIIPIISLYALVLYRMLPAFSRMLSNLSSVAYNQRSLSMVYNDIFQETESHGDSPIQFNKTIKVKNLSFEYNTGNEVLSDINLQIQKGDKIAITGESGSGKSTLVDILIGLHGTVKDSLYIDDVPITSANIRSWRSKIGYIPQSIYLFDGTVAENVAFGSTYNTDHVISVLKIANIWDLLETKDGINTLVGENGIQLSGGQKQRIGIARALYDNPDILVLDEATSALDSETESKIMDEIYNISSDKTLIVIAHRLSTVERCDRRVELNSGQVVS